VPGSGSRHLDSQKTRLRRSSRSLLLSKARSPLFVCPRGFPTDRLAPPRRPHDGQRPPRPRAASAYDRGRHGPRRARTTATHDMPSARPRRTVDALEAVPSLRPRNSSHTGHGRRVRRVRSQSPTCSTPWFTAHARTRQFSASRRWSEATVVPTVHWVSRPAGAGRRSPTDVARIG
jgi:hypothetical protein